MVVVRLDGQDFGAKKVKYKCYVQQQNTNFQKDCFSVQYVLLITSTFQFSIQKVIRTY